MHNDACHTALLQRAHVVLDRANPQVDAPVAAEIQHLAEIGCNVGRGDCARFDVAALDRGRRDLIGSTGTSISERLAGNGMQRESAI